MSTSKLVNAPGNESGNSGPKLKAKKQPTNQLNVRVGQEWVAWFSEFAKRLDTSHPDLIIPILKHLKRLEDEGLHAELKRLLGGGDNATLDDLIAQLGWSEHAFGKNQLIWALQEYRRLEENADLSGKRPVQFFAQFRQSHCWIHLAMYLQRKALRLWLEGDVANAMAHLDEAVSVVDMSIEISDRLENGIDHRVIYYNKSCSLSQRARFRVERAMLQMSAANTELVPGLRTMATAVKTFRENPSSQAARDLDLACKEWWSTEGSRWREFVDASTARDITTDGNAALESLRKIHDEGLRQGAFPAIVGFIYEFASEDFDLLFLRFDPTAKPLFDHWLHSQLEASERGLLAAVRAMRHSVKAEAERGHGKADTTMEGKPEVDGLPRESGPTAEI